MITLSAAIAGAAFAQTAQPGSSAQAGNKDTSGLAQALPKAKKAGKSAAPLTIPETAVDRGDGTFRYVDSSGTAWIYTKTPFGVSRQSEAAVIGHTGGQTPFGESKNQGVAAPVAAPAPVTPGSKDDPDAKVTAVASGDIIEFTRPTPFGATRWKKNKNDLTPQEKTIWARVQPKGNQ
jgi:hypothetical protein